MTSEENSLLQNIGVQLTAGGNQSHHGVFGSLEYGYVSNPKGMIVYGSGLQFLVSYCG